MESPTLSLSGFEEVDIRTPCLNLGEFEEDASPLPEIFCGQMTSEQFESQGASETEKALMGLVEHIQNNPSTLMNVMRKRKQEEVESNGLVSYIKSRVLSKVQGDGYRKKLVTEKECKDKAEEMTQGMLVVYDYFQETKGHRYSKRLAARRKQQCLNETPIKKTALYCQQNENKPMEGMLPPPPPPPPHLLHKILGRKYSKTKVCGPPPHPPVPPPVLTPLKDTKNIMLYSPAVAELKRPPLRTGSTGSLVSVHEELLSSNPLTRLRATKQTRSPGGTPSRKGRGLNTSTDSLDLRTPLALKNQESLSSIFMRILDEKFKNIRSPSPCVVQNESVFSPGTFSP